MTNPSDIAFSFEAVLLGATKDKNGFVIKLSVHPQDVPEELMRDFVGTRYQVACVKLADDGKPVGKPKAQVKGEVQHAALLCKNPAFQKFIAAKYFGTESEKEARDLLCSHCGIETRADLNNIEQARRKFHALVKEYEAWALG